MLLFISTLLLGCTSELDVPAITETQETTTNATGTRIELKEALECADAMLDNLQGKNLI